MSATRSAANAALFTLLSNAYPWGLTARRIKLWTDIPNGQRPSLMMGRCSGFTYHWTGAPTVKRIYTVMVMITIVSSDANPGSIQLDAIADALDAAMLPTGRDLAIGRNTLGGTCFQARIKDFSDEIPGDLGDDGLMVLQVEIVLP